MRRLLYTLLLALVLCVPLKRINIADLLPVEGLAVYMEDGLIALETDTAHKGVGQTVGEALASLKESTPKMIYLDTVKYLLVSEDATEQVEALDECLKSSVKVAVCEAKGKVNEVAQYLRLNLDMPTLKQWKNKIENIKNSA